MRKLDTAWDRARILRNREVLLLKIKEAARETLGSNLIGVYLFGSAVTGEIIDSSDVDILIVAKGLPRSLVERSELKERIIEKSGLPLIHPFEIHLVDEDEAKIYFRHIGEKILEL
ncbi:MAG: nucleotidyltransferase domain-containing protein [Infirmifilum sp.]